MLTMIIAACAEEVTLNEEETAIEDEAEDEIEDEVEETEEETETQEGITREKVAQNNNEESCYVGYYGYVYDLTSWLNAHPGGKDEILPHCGTVEEFTEAYDNRHGQKDELNRNEAIAQLI